MLLKNIQFLRGAAAFAVIIYHLAAYFINTPHVIQIMHDFFLQFGYAGVDVFFVISGYVIWISTHGRKNSMTPALFAYKRATRIYLGYWPYFLLVMLILWYFAPQELSYKNLLGSLFLTELSIPDLVLQVAWTLSFELYFYLLFTLFLFFTLHRSKQLLVLFAALIIATQAYGILVLDIYAAAELPSASPLFTFFFSPFCLQFLAGVAVAVFFEKHRLLWLKTAAVLCISLFYLTLWLQTHYLIDNHYFYMGYYTPLRVLLFGGIAVLLVMMMVEVELRGKQFWPRFATWFGDASYSLYLSHTPLLFVFSQIGLVAWGQKSEWQHALTVSLIVGLIFAYSFVHYRLIELPLMQWARKMIPHIPWLRG